MDRAGSPLRTRETVETCTPAAPAMSISRDARRRGGASGPGRELPGPAGDAGWSTVRSSMSLPRNAASPLPGRPSYGLRDGPSQQDRGAERPVGGQPVGPVVAQLAVAGPLDAADPGGGAGDVGGPDRYLQHAGLQRRRRRGGPAAD